MSKLNILNILKKKIYKQSYKKSLSNLNKHFSPVYFEWADSIYQYNKKLIKILPILHKITEIIIKNYFNMFFVKKNKFKIKNYARKRRLRTKSKRYSIKRIFISNPEIKHTNTKAIIIVYIYNAEKKYILKKLKDKFLKKRKKNYIKKIRKNYLKKLLQVKKINLIIPKKIGRKNRWRKLNLNQIKILRFWKRIFLYKKLIKKYTKYYFKHKKINKKDLLFFYESEKILKEKAKHYYDNYFKYYKKLLKKEKLIILYKYLLWLNKSKFQDTYIKSLSKLLRQFFNKKIVFNLINIKYIYLNSNIYSQILILKLKNRKNKLNNLLKQSFYNIRFPFYKKLINTYEVKWKKKNKDYLNNYLLKKDKNQLINLNKIIQKKNLKEKKFNFLKKKILHSINQKTIIGIRFEMTGRISGRFIAARSLYQYKHKGTLKNINSSYRGLSSVILRGYLESNLQYTKVTSKTRIGSYGFKGWINMM